MFENYSNSNHIVHQIIPSDHSWLRHHIKRFTKWNHSLQTTQNMTKTRENPIGSLITSIIIVSVVNSNQAFGIQFIITFICHIWRIGVSRRGLRTPLRLRRLVSPSFPLSLLSQLIDIFTKFRLSSPLLTPSDTPFCNAK